MNRSACTVQIQLTISQMRATTPEPQGTSSRVVECLLQMP